MPLDYKIYIKILTFCLLPNNIILIPTLELKQKRITSSLRYKSIIYSLNQVRVLRYAKRPVLYFLHEILGDLRWLATVSNTFQDLDFDLSL